MKILTLATYYTPYRSGLSDYARRVNEDLARRGHSVTVVSTLFQAMLPQKETVNGVRIIRCPYLLRISKGFLSPVFWLTAIRQVFLNDTVILHLPQPEVVPVVAVARLLKKKIVIIYHCDLDLGIGILVQAMLLLIDFSHKIQILLADRVIVNSRDYASHSRLSRYFGKKTGYLSPPPADYRVEPEEKAKLLKRYPALKDSRVFKIGFVGRIAREKGLEYLLTALPDLQKKLKPNIAVLFIAGPGDSVGEEAYRRQIEEMIVENQNMVVRLGELRDCEMGAFLATLDVLVVPSVNSTESFGMVQAEAMRLGVPVVASNLPGVRELIATTAFGYTFAPGNPEEILNAVVKIYKNHRVLLQKKPTAIIESLYEWRNKYESVIC